VIVAPGRDQVADADLLPCGCWWVLVVHQAGGDEPVTDRGVQRGDLLAGVNHHVRCKPGEVFSEELLGNRCVPVVFAAGRLIWLRACSASKVAAGFSPSRIAA
jgi:hypothetical protein